MRTTVTLVLTMTSVVAMSIGAGWALAEAGGSHDDGWRRTASGWERLEGWNESEQQAFATPATPDATNVRSAERLDGHPAVLVAVQLLAIGLAFLAFPRRSPTAGTIRRVTRGQPPWYVPAWIF